MKDFPEIEPSIELVWLPQYVSKTIAFVLQAHSALRKSGWGIMMLPDGLEVAAD